MNDSDPRFQPTHAEAVAHARTLIAALDTFRKTQPRSDELGALETELFTIPQRVLRWYDSGATVEDPRPAAASQWIACSERIPEVGDWLTWDAAKPTWAAREMCWSIRYGSKPPGPRWREVDGKGPRTTPTHWMPLPAPPKETT